MDKMNKFSYPPCSINPMTERPFTRHKWTIVANGTSKVKPKGDRFLHVYRVRCSRCGMNDPNPPGF